MSKTYFNISDKLRLYEFDGMLDQYGDAAAAYSLRKLRNGYTGDAIRVRRSSDNTERDMGFYDNELDTVALLDWVNEEILHFNADLNDPTGWTLRTGVTIAGGAINFDNANSSTAAYKGYGAIPYEKVRVTFTIENYVSGAVNWANYGGGAQDADFKTADGTYIVERVLGGGNSNWGFSAQSFTGSVTQNKVEIIASNGLVHTWYDQSANANHAVQGTATAQPKIVDAGVVVTDNGKAAVEFDGNDDNLNTSAFEMTSAFSVFGTFNMSATNGYRALISHNFVSSGSAYLNQGRWILIRTAANANDWLGGDSALIGDGSSSSRYPRFISNGSVFSANTQYAVSGVLSNTTSQLWANGSASSVRVQQTASITSETGKVYIGSSEIYDDFQGKIQEVMIWDTDQSANRTGIEFNINTYYDIY